jgi:protein SCO1/2
MLRFSSFFAAAAIAGNVHGFDEKAALNESQAAIGRQVGNYRFVDSNNRKVSFADLRGKPLVINFVYTGCFQACPATTQFLAGAVKQAERALGPGTFRVATIGFNLPVDDPRSMRAFARKFAIDAPHWLFLTPEAESLDALTRELGFRYEATAAGFDHLLQVSILDGEGRVYRQVYGDSFDAPLFVGPLLELARNAPVEQNTLEAAWEKFKILCTVYDPAAGRYRVNYVVVIEILVGASVMLFGVGFVLWEWRRRRLMHIKSGTARSP